MKKNCILVNVARGYVIDEAALYSHLLQNPEFKCGLDVWWHYPKANEKFSQRFPLFKLPNFLGTPHVSGYVPEEREVALNFAVDNILRFVKNRPLRGLMESEDYRGLRELIRNEDKLKEGSFVNEFCKTRVNELAKTKSINLNDLTKLATWLDGYSVMSPVDPLRLRKIANRYRDDQDIGTAWKEIESDVWDIARIPSTSPEITRLSKILGVLKQVLMFVGLIVFTIYIIGSGLGTLNFLGRYGALVFAIIFILAYLLGFGSYFYLDRKLTRLVTNCYKKHANEISKQRKHVKQVNQRLIDKIAAEIRSRRADPEKYRFSLMQKDYSNIVVQKEQGDSVFVVSIKGSKKID